MEARKILCAVVVLAAVASPPAAATNDFGVFGSYTKPSDADSALGGGARFRFGFLDLRATYFTDLTRRQASDICPPFCSNNKPKVRFAPLEAGLVWKIFDWSGQPNQWASPYIGGGAGYYLLH